MTQLAFLFWIIFSNYCIIPYNNSTLFRGRVIQKEQWELKKNESGIQVFTRNVEGSDIKAFRATTTFSCPVYKLLDVARDPAGYSRWIADCKHSELLKPENLYTYIAYLQLDMPWPLQNRDMVLRVSITDTGQEGSYIVKLTAVPDFIPPREDFVRLTIAEGFFRFTTAAGGKVSVEYEFHADPGGHLPSGLVNSQIVKAPLETLKNLRKLVNG